MATIKYKGMELEEFFSDKPVIFDPPKKCIVWDAPFYKMKQEAVVLAYIPKRATNSRVIGIYNQSWGFCAILPENTLPRRATNREISQWLAQGNGEVQGSDGYADTAWNYPPEFSNTDVRDGAKIRKWDDTEWHEPTADYMGLEEA